MKSNLLVRAFVMFVLAFSVSAMAQDSPMTNITGGGTKGTVPLFTGAHKIGNSSITEDSSGDLTLAQNVHVGENVASVGWMYSDNYLDTAGTVYSIEADTQGGPTYSGQGWFQNAGSSLGIGTSDVDGTQVIQAQTLASSGINIATFDVNGDNTFLVDSAGDTYAAGSKSAVVPLKNGEMVAVYSQESPQVWFEDFGTAHLVGGVATVKLESKFAQLVDTKMPYHVFLTPDGDCHGLYVAQKDRNSFEVRELDGGQSNVEFDYRISALRNGYENVRLKPVKMATLKQVPAHAPAPKH